MIEPYRLWFEYLKTALSDPRITVDRSIYADWGDVENADFDEWWEGHWRTLFAARTTSLVQNADEFETALGDPAYVVVSVPVATTAEARSTEIERIVAAELKRRGRSKRQSGARFVIDAKRTMRRDVLRGMLRLYGLFLENDHDLTKAAVAYHDWATAWNQTVKDKKWKRQRVYVPPELAPFVDAVRQIDAAATPEERRYIRQSKRYDLTRSKIRRYIHRAEKIARNVGKGTFPGDFR